VVVRWIYRHSELILVQSQSFIPLVEALACGSPVRYQPNPGELSFETPTQDQPVLVFEPGFNVVFAGNLGTVQALDTVLDAAELLMAYPDVRIVLIGSGSRESWLMQETARRSLRNVRFSQRMPPEAMPAIFSQASALLVSLIRNPIMNQTIPSKVQAYLAAGRPIIACLDGEGARVIQESGAGAACPAEDAPALAKAILRLRDAPKDDLQRMGEAGRCYYRQHFDSVLLAEKLIGHFKDAASRRLGSESGSVRHE
jgi:glycosyltransferase involved in cell wall biosynthesis